MKQFYFLFLFMWVCSNDIVCSDCCFTIQLFLLVVNAWLEDPMAATAEGWRKQSDGTEAAKDSVLYVSSCVCSLRSQQLEMNSHDGSCR